MHFRVGLFEGDFNMRPIRQRSALGFVLRAMIPYSRENLLLGFRPSQFFNELEKISMYKRRALEEAARRAEERGFLERNKEKQLRLTELGMIHALPFTAQKLKGGNLMVVFDISEDLSRDRFRKLLKNWQFRPIQKSVWTTNYDHRESIRNAVKILEIEDSVRVYECRSLYPREN